jgi:hypothetical protein
MDSRKSLLIAILERLARSEVRFGDHLSATTTRGGKVIGFSESQGRGRASAADVKSDGTISLIVTGSSSLGEQDTLRSCQLLIERLNKTDPLWSLPVLGTHPSVDAETTAVGRDDKLHMQVVRAITNSEFWRELGRSGTSGLRNVTPDEAASGIKDSILQKAGSIPPSDRSRLVLVLNSIDSPSLVLDPVIDAFRKMHQPWARSLGFREIWIVGPWSDLTHRLD